MTHSVNINVAQVQVSVGTKYDLFTACTVMCNSNTLLPIRAVPNMGFSVFGRIRMRIVVDGKKKTNASCKRARHALCNMIQSLGYTLNVKC